MVDVSLTINGAIYGGWESVQISRGVEQIAGTFELSVSERWPGQATPMVIRPGDACTVSIDSEVLITGYVDDVTPEYDDASHTVSVSGRDKTADLVDCSAIHASGQWSGRSMAQIATDLCAPFGVAVKAETDTGAAFGTFALQEGEAAFEAVERLARMRGVLLVSDGKGGLLITRAGTEKIPTQLIEGENILTASATLSWRDRYSKYILKGQAAGGDFTTPSEHSQAQAVATDPNITRYRPLIIMAEDQGTSGSIKDRAIWEAAVRLGKGSRATISVQGWRHGAGLWQPNRLVQVVSPWLGLNREMLIATCAFVLDESGSRTELGLVLPEAYSLVPLPDKKKKKKEADAW